MALGITFIKRKERAEMSPAAARRWYEGYCQEVERSIAEANKFNSQQVWTTRKMTVEEYDAVFGEKPVSCHKLKIPKEVNKCQ